MINSLLKIVFCGEEKVTFTADSAFIQFILLRSFHPSDRYMYVSITSTNKKEDKGRNKVYILYEKIFLIFLHSYSQDVSFLFCQKFYSNNFNN